MANETTDMDELSIQSLYVLMIESSDGNIKRLAREEFMRREMTIAQIDEIALWYEKPIVPTWVVKDRLSLEMKVILLAIPGFILFLPVFHLFHLFEATDPYTYLSKGHKKKWKSYWRYASAGFLLWTVILIVLIRMEKGLF